MGERLSHATRSDGGRKRLAQILMAARGMSSDDALAWCDKWEHYAAKTGLRSESAYFWDAARGWIDAQLDDDARDSGRRSSSRGVGAA